MVGQNDLSEADKIIQLISENTSNNDYDLSDIVILYRTNAQSRIIEDKLRKKAIPYQIIGGVKIYERKEKKDILAFLKIISNSMDNVSMQRILNFPPRGIGLKTFEKIKNYSNQNQYN